MAKKILITISSVILLLISLSNLQVMIGCWGSSLVGVVEQDGQHIVKQTMGIWESNLLPDILVMSLIFAGCAIVGLVALILRKDIFAIILSICNLLIIFPYLLEGRAYLYQTGYFISARYYLGYYLFYFFEAYDRIMLMYVVTPLIGMTVSFVALYLIKRNKKEAV